MDSATNRLFAVVTGASSGIGYQLAMQFAENGFDVLVTAEDDGIETAAQEIGASGADLTAVQLDLAKYEGVEELYETIESIGRPWTQSLSMPAWVWVEVLQAKPN